MSTVRRLVLFMAGGFLVSCADSSSSSLTAPSRNTLPPVSFDNQAGPGNNVTQSVDGHAAFAVTSVPGEFEEYSVNAKARASGEAFGELELKQQRNGQDFMIHGTILCVSASNHSARLAAQVTMSNHPDVRVGQYLAWSVTDNDVNDHDVKPDLSTEFYLLDRTASQAYCQAALFAAPYYSIKGHLEVRDATESKHD